MSSSPDTPRTLIKNVLSALETSKPVTRQAKRRKSSSSSRRQSLNNSTLRKQAVLSSANQTEQANATASELTPRSQIQGFLGAVKTAAPITRQKRHAEPGEMQEESSSKKKRHPADSFDETDMTARTLISSVLNASNTGMTAAPLKRQKNIPRSPLTRSMTRQKESLQQSALRSPNSDSSLLDVTIHQMRSAGKFGHVPRMRPTTSGLVDTMSKVQSTASSSMSGIEDADLSHMTHSKDGLNPIPETPHDVEEDDADADDEEEDTEKETGGNKGNKGTEETGDKSNRGTEEAGDKSNRGTEEAGDKGNRDTEEAEDKDAENNLARIETGSERVSDSVGEEENDISHVPDLSVFYKSGSTQQESRTVNQSPEVTGQPHIKEGSMNAEVRSLSVKDDSVRDRSSILERSNRELIIPLEVPKKPRVQVKISFPVVGKQVATGGTTETKRRPSARSKGVRRSPTNQSTQKVNSACNLPRSLTKSIFCHFSKCKSITNGALDEVEKACDQFWRQFTTDVVAFADHAGRISVSEKDVELLMRRQGFVTDNQSMYTLVEKYLPMEYREEIIPVAKSGNVVIPKK